MHLPATPIVVPKYFQVNLFLVDTMHDHLVLAGLIHKDNGRFRLVSD
jgi:hypothetical protein